MKEVVLVMVSLFIGMVSGYLCRDYHLEEEAKGDSTYVYTSQYENYTGEDDWEYFIFQESVGFGPV